MLDGEEMTQEELNKALWAACGIYNNLPRVVELLDRGANPNAFVHGTNNAMYRAAVCGFLEIVMTLLDRGAELETRDGWDQTALLGAALDGHLEVCLLLISRGADLLTMDKHGRGALTRYDNRCGLDPAVKAEHVSILKKAWREGPHPSQVQRRKDEQWEKGWPLLSVATGCGLLLMDAKKAELKASALPTDAKIPDEPTETEAQRRVLRQSKVLGNVGLLRHIKSFIPDKEWDESEGI